MIPTSPVDRLSATEYAIISWCPHAYRLGYKQGLPLKWELPRSEDYGGPDVGSLVHWILARWNLRKESLAGFFPQKDDDLEALLRLLPTGLRPVLKDKTHWTILMRWLDAFRESPLGLSLQNVQMCIRDRACNRFDEAQISTIHSFAMNLLKSYGQFLEINPNFNIVTPQQEDIFYESAVNALDLLDENWFSRNVPSQWHKKTMDLMSCLLYTSRCV